MRVGIGYDIHRLQTGGPLILGGVELTSELGLVGHSDADVVLHAVMDALLGAAALGDIGRHFPPSDDRYLGASSVGMLETVSALLAKEGYNTVNVDVVIVTEHPRIAPYADPMCRVIASALKIEPDSVSIKATTNEGVGPEGRGEAISARAVALIARP